MTNDPKNPQVRQSALSNPQVLAAIIGGVVTLVAATLGVLPSILNSNRAAPATAVIVVTATPQPATAVVIEPTAIPVVPTTAPTEAQVVAVEPSAAPPTATSIPATEALPSATPVPPTAIPAPAANVLLLWDEVSFTAVNQDTRVVSFVGITFSSSGGFWDAREWGPSLYNSVPSRNCLRLRDQTAGQRQPPRECGNLYGLILVGGPAIFWRGVDSFDVLRDGQVVATCPTAAGRCGIYVS